MQIVKRVKAKWRCIRNQIKVLKLNLYIKKYDKRTHNLIFDKSNIKNIVILRWDDKLGDAMMCGNFIKILRQYRPDIHITVLTGLTTKSWLNKAAPADNYIIYSKEKRDQIIQNNMGKFDLFIDLGTHCSYKDIYLLSKFKAKHYLGFNRQKYALFDVNIDNKYHHFKERYIAAAQLLVNQAIGKINGLPTPDFLVKKVELQQLVSRTKLTYNNVVAINFFGSGKYRRFSFEQAKMLLIRWRQQFPQDLLIIIPTPNEEKFTGSLVTILNDPAIILPQQLACFEMSLAIINIADFTFTPDTAVVHMASAINKPVIGVYRQNMQNYEEWKPLGNHSQCLLNRQPFCSDDSVHVHEFDWQDLVLARSTILKALA